MMTNTYHMTVTAEEHFWNALLESKQKWGSKRAEKYRLDFLVGLQNIADNHHRFHSPHRMAMAQGADFSLHLVENRYVAFQAHGKKAIIIAGIFHARMDISARLKELQQMSAEEISTLKRHIENHERGLN